MINDDHDKSRGLQIIPSRSVLEKIYSSKNTLGMVIDVYSYCGSCSYSLVIDLPTGGSTTGKEET